MPWKRQDGKNKLQYEGCSVSNKIIKKDVPLFVECPFIKRQLRKDK